MEADGVGNFFFFSAMLLIAVCQRKWSMEKCEQSHFSLRSSRRSSQPGNAVGAACQFTREIGIAEPFLETVLFEKG